MANEARSVSDYKSSSEPVWCPGCGDFGVLSALTKAMANLNLDPKDVAIVSGIGCSGRLPYFVNSFGFHGVHGRALPTALGVKEGNPNLTVIAAGGDGDGLSIGAGHFPHMARRNPDVTYVMMNNMIYGLTKGQAAPTSHHDFKTGSTPYGAVEEEMNPIVLALAYHCSFIARGYSGKPNHLTDLIARGIRHKGFSFIEAVSPCPTFNKVDTYKAITPTITEIPAGHDVKDWGAAMKLAGDHAKTWIGVFYEETRPTFEDLVGETTRRSVGDKAASVETIARQFM